VSCFASSPVCGIDWFFSLEPRIVQPKGDLDGSPPVGEGMPQFDPIASQTVRKADNLEPSFVH